MSLTTRRRPCDRGNWRSSLVYLLFFGLALSACASRDDDPPPQSAANADDGGVSNVDRSIPDAGGVPDALDGALSIYDLQDESSEAYPGVDTSVTVAGIVTAVDTLGFADDEDSVGSFFIQNRSGGPYSGIEVYNFGGNTIDVSSLQVGQRVEVSGTFVDYFGLSEIQADTLTVLDETPDPLSPQTVDPADVATGGALAEAYEGVLVEVLDVEVTDDSLGYGKFVVTNGLEVDDELYSSGSVPAIGTPLERIAGVLTYTFEAVQLLPRDQADFASASTDPGTDGLTIYDIQDESSPDHPAADTQVSISGIVTAVDNEGFDDDPDSVGSFFVQDPAGGPYSGIQVYNFDGDAVDISGLEVGQRVDVSGTYVEFYGLSEIQVGALTIHDDSIALISPVPVDPADVATGGSLAEAYEGVLVEITGVEVTDNSLGFGKFVVTGGLEVDNELYSPALPAVGTELEYLAGVLTYSFDAVQLLPRSAADYSGVEDPPDPPEGVLSIYALQDETDESHPSVGSTVTVGGRVTAVDDHGFDDDPNTAGSFYIQDPEGGAYSGLFVFNLNGDTIDTAGLRVGQAVEVTGTYEEFYGLTELSATAYSITDTGIVEISPTAVDPGDVATAGTLAEAYEGVLVEVEGVTVTETDIGFGKFVITGGLEIDDELHTIEPAPSVDDVFDRLAGILTYSFDAVQLLPRSGEDL